MINLQDESVRINFLSTLGQSELDLFNQMAQVFDYDNEAFLQAFSAQIENFLEEREVNPLIREVYPKLLKKINVGQLGSAENKKIDHNLGLTEEQLMSGAFALELQRKTSTGSLYFYGMMHDTSKASIYRWNSSNNPSDSFVNWQENHLYFDPPASSEYKVLIWQRYPVAEPEE